MDMNMDKPRGKKSTLLERYEKEIFSLRDEGYSYQQIVDFLKEKKIIVSISTVRKFLMK